MIDQAVLNKIANLFKLADNAGATPGESANAAAAAQALLEKYKLERADLPGAIEAEEEINVFARIVGGKRKSKWESILSYNVGKINGCQGIITYDQEGNINYCILGTKDACQITVYMYTYLVREIDRLARLALLRGDIEGKSGSNAFRLGCVETVIHRMQAAKVQARQEATSTALVVVNREEARVNEEMVKRGMDPNGQKVTFNANARDMQLGREAGNKISLNQGLGSSNTVKELR